MGQSSCIHILRVGRLGIDVLFLRSNGFRVAFLEVWWLLMNQVYVLPYMLQLQLHDRVGAKRTYHVSFQVLSPSALRHVTRNTKENNEVIGCIVSGWIQSSDKTEASP